MRAAHAQADAAIRRLAERTPTLLSDLSQLDRDEFAQFLALVDAALISPPASDGTRSGVTPTVEIRLRPLGDAQIALVRTAEGTLRCPEHELVVTLLEEPRREEAVG
jgi:hypothetical protein